MRNIITYLIRKRNKAFRWNESLSSLTILEFAFQQCMNLLRGWRVLLSLRKPKMMLRGKDVSIKGISRFHWGNYLRLGDHAYINAIGINGISLGEKVGIGAYSRLIVSGDISNPGQGIKIGNNVGIGEFAYLGGAGGLEIGKDTIAGQYLSCHPENHIFSDPQLPTRLQGVTRKGIKIGANCWIGSKVTILDGVTIGDNCVIAAGSVITKSFPDNSVIGGVPAKKLKDTCDNTSAMQINHFHNSIRDAI